MSRRVADAHEATTKRTKSVKDATGERSRGCGDFFASARSHDLRGISIEIPIFRRVREPGPICLAIRLALLERTI